MGKEILLIQPQEANQRLIPRRDFSIIRPMVPSLLARYKTLAMTQRYSHLAPEELQNAVKLLDGVSGDKKLLITTWNIYYPDRDNPWKVDKRGLHIRYPYGFYFIWK